MRAVIVREKQGWSFALRVITAQLPIPFPTRVPGVVIGQKYRALQLLGNTGEQLKLIYSMLGNTSQK